MAIAKVNFLTCPPERNFDFSFITFCSSNFLIKLLIYKLHSHRLKQQIIQRGGIIKFLSNTAWNMNIKTLELTKTQIKFENFLYKKFTSKQINLIHVRLLNLLRIYKLMLKLLLRQITVQSFLIRKII